ncbi:caspase family protein [Solimonas sp. K1W22B-7]|uniref:caspase family protein n=1 Tax=Solimonas sp. K1W22B-7 TaxID=2303331 RepID=UPI000E32F477|nr:caspase family protein [Solimonas sp. K1W22B-7]AXQ27858.1 caspase family protein [Solimonas sp. K1W22B-7]
MKAWARRVCVAAVALRAVCIPASADADALPGAEADKTPRLALVISTSEYGDHRLSNVSNALNDGRLVAERLVASEFDTVLRENADYESILTEVDDLADRRIRLQKNRRVRPLVVVYFSGHGYRAGDNDFITGSDVNFDSPTESSVSVQWIMSRLASDSTAIIFVDACRSHLAKAIDNEDPLAKAFAPIEDRRERESEQILYPTRNWHARNGMYLFATEPGKAAWNSAKRSPHNSPFAQQIGVELNKPGVPLASQITGIIKGVGTATEEKQAPQPVGSVGTVYLLENEESQEEMQQKWNRARTSATLDDVNRYLDDYPAGPWRSAAIEWLDHNKGESR